MSTAQGALEKCVLYTNKQPVHCRRKFEFEMTRPTIFHLRVLDNNAFNIFHHFLPGKWDTTSLLGFLAALSLISSSVAIKACLDECKVWPSCRRFVDQTPRWKPQTWHWTHQGWKIETQKDIMRASYAFFGPDPTIQFQLVSCQSWHQGQRWRLKSQRTLRATSLHPPHLLAQPWQSTRPAEGPFHRLLNRPLRTPRKTPGPRKTPLRWVWPENTHEDENMDSLDMVGNGCYSLQRVNVHSVIKWLMRLRPPIIPLNS